MTHNSLGRALSFVGCKSKMGMILHSLLLNVVWIYITSFLSIAPLSLSAQSVVVDRGTFTLSIHGDRIGTEEFIIRRAGLGNEAAFISRGVVTRTLAATSEEFTTLLRVTAPEGMAAGYEFKSANPVPIEIMLNISGSRYFSRFISPQGQEEREFRAKNATRIVEHQVAHHLYFLRNLKKGSTVHVIEPRSRTDREFLVTDEQNEEIRIGRNHVTARRVIFLSSDGDRIVWFDMQGRVLRLEIPTTGYLAIREDLVG